MAKLPALILVLLFALTSACGVPLVRSDLPLGGLARKCPEGELARADRQAIEARLSQQYGMKIAAAEASCRQSSISCNAIEPDQGRTIALLYELIDSEFARYPAGFLRDHGPREIWLVNDLFSNTRSSDVAGVAFYASRIVYLAVPSLCSDESFKHTVQHEVFHVLDPQVVSAYRREDTWAALNPPGFRYVGVKEKKEGRSAVRPLGFASSYGQVSQFEDRAELFAFGTVAPWANEHAQLARSDAYLSEKRRTLSTWMTELWPELSPLLSELSRY